MTHPAESWRGYNRSALLTAVTRFENAAVDLSWKGSMHPDDHYAIERRYMLAKANLLRKLGFEVVR